MSCLGCCNGGEDAAEGYVEPAPAAAAATTVAPAAVPETATTTEPAPVEPTPTSPAAAAAPAEPEPDEPAPAEAAPEATPEAAPAIDPRCLQAAVDSRLCVFVGAGTSMIPPTSLPSWTQINQAVLKGLVDRAKPSPEADMAKYTEAIRESLIQGELPPEYFAEVCVTRFGSFYFRVISVLDSATPNSVHKAIAELVRSGCCKAVVTTNFDLCVEAALAAAGVQPIVWKEDSEFSVETIAKVFGDGQADAKAEGPPTCLVLKVHGSADCSWTVVDTLSQRSLGLGDNISGCLSALLDRAHWLFLGYSGADLAAAPNYLTLRETLPTARGWTWLVRQGWDPLAAVTKIQAEYGEDKAAIDYGELPQYLDPLLAEARGRGADAAPEVTGAVPERSTASLEDRVREWSENLLMPESAVAVSDLLVATKNAKLAVELLEMVVAQLATDDDPRNKVAFAETSNALAAIRSVQGQQEDAIALNRKAVEMLSSIDAAPVEAAALDPRAVILDDISSPHATYVRACEVRARALRDEGNAVRTAVLTDSAFGEAQTLFESSLAAYQALPESARSTRGKALCEMGLGDVLRASTNPGDEASVLQTLGHYDTVIALAKSIGDLPMQAVALKNQGITLKAKGTAASVETAAQEEAMARAYEKYKAALQVQKRIGDALEMVKSLRGLAGLYLDRDHYAEAEDFAEQSLALAAKIGYRAGEARAIRVLGEAATGKKEYERAAELVRKSLTITEELGDKSGVARGRFGLAKVLEKGGDKDAARAEAEQARATFEAIGEKKQLAKVVAYLDKLQ